MPTGCAPSAAAPAPMKTSAKVPMSSATSEVESLLYIEILPERRVRSGAGEGTATAPGGLLRATGRRSLPHLFARLRTSDGHRTEGRMCRHGVAATEIPSHRLRHL